MQLHGTGLGEHVDHGMPVRAERQPGAGVAQRDARADAVGEIGLGGRAEAGEHPGVTEGADVVAVRCVAWTAVVRGVQTPASASNATGVIPVAARQVSFSAGCSETCTCSGASGSAAATTASCSRGTARTEWMAAPITTSGSPV